MFKAGFNGEGFFTEFDVAKKKYVVKCENSIGTTYGTVEGKKLYDREKMLGNNGGLEDSLPGLETGARESRSRARCLGSCGGPAALPRPSRWVSSPASRRL